jgi:hypothetical protein
LTKLAEVNRDSLIDIALSLLILREALHCAATLQGNYEQKANAD